MCRSVCLSHTQLQDQWGFPSEGTPAKSERKEATVLYIPVPSVTNNPDGLNGADERPLCANV